MFATALRSLRIIEVSAHCDLPCGVYDPAQARIEAESIKAIDKKVRDIVADSADFAQNNPEPDASELYTDILL